MLHEPTVADTVAGNRDIECVSLRCSCHTGRRLNTAGRYREPDLGSHVVGLGIHPLWRQRLLTLMVCVAHMWGLIVSCDGCLRWGCSSEPEPYLLYRKPGFNQSGTSESPERTPTGPAGRVLPEALRTYKPSGTSQYFGGHTPRHDTQIATATPY